MAIKEEVIAPGGEKNYMDKDPVVNSIIVCSKKIKEAKVDIVKVDWRCRQKGGTESHRLNRNTWKKEGSSISVLRSSWQASGEWDEAREEVRM